MIFIGVDPGVSGGLAELGKRGANGIKMPGTEKDVWEWVQPFMTAPLPVFAVIERVGGYVGEAQPGSAAFKFGASYGGLRMALVAAGIPFEEVTPQKWQKEYQLARGKGESKTSWKNRLKAKAQQLFPDLVVTLATADALLIAEYARRTRGRGVFEQDVKNR